MKNDIIDDSYFDRAVSISLFILVVIWSALLFANYWGPDINYWSDWALSLQTGLTSSDANYPPIFLYWLYVGGKLWHQFAMIAPTDIVIKTFISIPLLAGYIFVIETAARYAKENFATRSSRFAVLAAAVSPAILYNSAAWGQVDILIYPFVMLAIISFLQKQPARSGFWFALALGTKMQVLFFAPTILGAIIFSRQFFIRWLISFYIGSTIVWLPWILQGQLMAGFKNAYLDNLHQQPVMNVSATNLWHLLGLSTNPIHEPFSSISKQFDLFGFSMPFPSLFFVAILITTFFSLIAMWNTWRNPTRIWECATLNCVTAFAFAPSMHERYLIPALLPALFSAIRNPQQLYVFYTITICGLINTILVLPPSGSGFLILTSSIVVAVPIIMSLDLLGFLTPILKLTTPKIYWLRRASWATPIVFIYFSVVAPYFNSSSKLSWQVSELILKSSSQSWGTLVRDRSVGNDIISVGGRTYSSGLGTHADSNIEVDIPQRAHSFCTLAGVQDQVNGKGLVFSILLDGLLTWKSEPLSSGEMGVPVCVDVKDHKVLTLIIKATDSEYGAHANWADAIFFDPQIKVPANF